MARPVRVEFPGACYHVMSHGVAGTPVFADDRDRLRFLELLREFVEIERLIVFALVLMRTHFHMLCQTPMAGLGRLMQKFLGGFTQCFNLRHHRRGHLWQARYKAIVVEEGDYFLHCSRYIHLNPMKSQICERPEDYVWSSYRRYLGPDDLFSWIDTSKTLECFGCASDYEAFVRQGLNRELLNPFEAAVGGLIFGSVDFVNQIRPLVRSPRLAEDVPSFQDLMAHNFASPAAIRETVCRVFSDASAAQLRKIQAYAMSRFTDLAGREVADLMGRSPTFVSHSRRVIQNRLSIDSILARKIETVAQALKNRQLVSLDRV